MRINADRNPYTVAYLKNNSVANKLQETKNSNVINSEKLDSELKNLAQSKLGSPEKIITTNERNFFKELFPENSLQIENHTLFTRNGRLQTLGQQKGTIIDGRI